MTITKYEPLSEDRRAALRHEPGVIYRRRTTEKPERFVPEIHVTGYIDTLELLGRRDDDEDSEEQHTTHESEETEERRTVHDGE
jgi:hypothetical protein